MENKDTENLEKLFGQFLDAAGAAEAAREIRGAEQILRDQPAPEPSPTLLAAIKKNNSTRLSACRHSVYITAALKTAVVAAVVVLFALVTLKYPGSEKSEAPSPMSLLSPALFATWDNLPEQDANLAVLTAEIEDIQSDIAAVRLGKFEDIDTAAAVNAVNIEMELIEIDSTFWKG